MAKKTEADYKIVQAPVKDLGAFANGVAALVQKGYTPVGSVFMVGENINQALYKGDGNQVTVVNNVS